MSSAVGSLNLWGPLSPRQQAEIVLALEKAGYTVTEGDGEGTMLLHPKERD